MKVGAKTIVAGVLAMLALSYFISSHAAFAPSAGSAGITIQIQPFDDISADKVNYAFAEIRKLYGRTVLLKPVKLPAQAYYKPRNRYRADTIIAWLSRRTPANAVTIGLTSKDISAEKGKVKDWGVMGLGYEPGNACVTSTFRLSKKNILDQLFKVSVHELGHTQGLPHCPNKGCYMQDAEGGNPTDDEHEFCPKCKAVLQSKGWVFQ